MKRIMNIFSSAAFILVTGLAGVSGTALATTPDGTTPANEGICDPLAEDGITKGLFGLCVAYCEAQDLDISNTEPPNPKILANYRKKMQPGDPDMPCVHEPCPCWTAEQFGEIIVDASINNCNETVDTTTFTAFKVLLLDDSEKVRFAEANISTGSEACRFVDLNPSPPIVNSQGSISPEAAQSCFDAIQQSCQTYGN